MNKQNGKTDRRVLYTKMFLKESLLELMKEKPVDKITPTELCRKAEINRNTFYKHYYTARDVLEEIEDEFSAQIVDSLSGFFLSGVLDIRQMLNEICRIVYENKDFCRILLSDNGDAAFFEKMVMLAKDVIIKNWQKDGVSLPDDQMDMFFAFTVNGSIALIGRWAANDMKNPPAEVAQLIERAAYGGINGLIDLK
ncbi:MAG: TetR/AcrR family transcriptional regulator C-terminal domain-containing protein [Clostridia bacterium]|nr:TetR/AcrR family transcriptional regulator C-terminal domain-containing protein [Clostridia bacterium]